MNITRKYDDDKDDIEIERKENEYLCSGYLREGVYAFDQINDDILTLLMSFTQ